MEKKKLEISYIQCRFEELDPEMRALAEAAMKATENSYTPYSHFNVGAALLLEDGTTVTGCNQENIAYPSGLCAERTALFSAGAMYPDKAVTAIAVAAFHEGRFTEEPVTPCGACRQVLAETESRYGKPVRVLLIGTEYCILLEDGVRSLLPFSFSF